MQTSLGPETPSKIYAKSMNKLNLYTKKYLHKIEMQQPLKRTKSEVKHQVSF